MSRVDFLRQSRDLSSVKFLEFTRIVSSADKKYALFFEGEDEKYYAMRISTINPDLRWAGINCGGKKNVLSLHHKIRAHTDYKSAKCLFFVDADFDDNSEISNHPDIYITPCYSIENLYLSDSVFLRVLSAEFGMTEHCADHACFSKVTQCFQTVKAQYLNHVTPFNIWLKAYRSLERQGIVTGKLNINNLAFDNLVKISLESCESVYDKTSIIKLFPDADQATEINLPSSDPITENSIQRFRGKQHLEFMRIYLMKLKEDRCKNKNRTLFQNKGNVRLTLTEGNSISELSHYAETPNCLRNFIGTAN